ncbi:MAG: PspC domain-containing protein [Ethanoligenens sp.]
MDKRLYRSRTQRMLAGVCGGIAEYFNVDPTLIRLAWVVFCFIGGSGILAYIIAAIVVPENPA